MEGHMMEIKPLVICEFLNSGCEDECDHRFPHYEEHKGGDCTMAGCDFGMKCVPLNDWRVRNEISCMRRKK